MSNKRRSHSFSSWSVVRRFTDSAEKLYTFALPISVPAAVAVVTPILSLLSETYAVVPNPTLGVPYALLTINWVPVL